jgi:hypothetical protein
VTDPQPAGPDLARQLLRQARADAKARGNNPKAAKRLRSIRSGTASGRDPARFEDILEQLAVAYDWKRPSASGVLMARWPQLAPDLAKHCTPERYDPDTRTLHLRPVSHAAATQLRLQAARIAADLNQAVAADTVATIRVLPPGPSRTPMADQDSPAPARPAAVDQPARARADAAPGYRRALAAAQEGRAAAPGDPHQELRDKHFADVRGTLREPQTAFTDGAAALEEAAEQSRGNDSEKIRQAAIKVARDQKAGRAPALPTVFQRTA